MDVEPVKTIENVVDILYRRKRYDLHYTGNIWGIDIDYAKTLEAERFNVPPPPKRALPDWLERAEEVGPPFCLQEPLDEAECFVTALAEINLDIVSGFSSHSLEDYNNSLHELKPTLYEMAKDLAFASSNMITEHLLNISLLSMVTNKKKVTTAHRGFIKTIELLERKVLNQQLKLHTASFLFWKDVTFSSKNEEQKIGNLQEGIIEFINEYEDFADYDIRQWKISDIAIKQLWNSCTKENIQGQLSYDKHSKFWIYKEPVRIYRDLFRELNDYVHRTDFSAQYLDRFIKLSKKLSSKKNKLALINTTNNIPTIFPLSTKKTKNKIIRLDSYDDDRIVRSSKFLRIKKSTNETEKITESIMDEFLENIEYLLEKNTDMDPVDIIECCSVPSLKYKIIKKLGSGATKIVFEGVHGDEHVAFKIIDLSYAGRELSKLCNIDIDTYLQRELNAVKLSNLKTRHISKIKEVFHRKDFIAIIEEKFSHTLSDVLKKSPKLKERDSLMTGCQILDALSACHEKARIAHGDLKEDNIGFDEEGQVKLTDFGLANSIKYDARLNRIHIGSSATRAPELFSGNLPTPSSDIWAVGALIYRMITGKYPFYYQPNIPVRQKRDYDRKVLQSIKRKVLWGDPGSMYTRTPITGSLQEILMRSIAYHPEDRFSSAREFKTFLEGHYSSLASQ